jgi:hypothetical protein
MDFSEMVRWIDKNLNIELECMHTGESNNQLVQARLKIGEITISKSDCEVLISDSKQTS